MGDGRAGGLPRGTQHRGGAGLAHLATVKGLENFALIIFPVLGAVGTFVHAMRQDHRRRLAEWEETKAERKAEAQRRKEERAEERMGRKASAPLAVGSAEALAPSAPLAAEGAGTLPDSGRTADVRHTTADGWRQREKKVSTGNAVLAFFAANPGATHEQAAEAIGVKRQTVSYWLGKLQAQAQAEEHTGGNGHNGDGHKSAPAGGEPAGAWEGGT